MVLLLRMLEGRSSKAMSRAEVAEALETSPRTVDRYVAALGQAVAADGGEPLVRKELRDGKAWVCLARETSSVAAGIYQYAAVWAATRVLKAGKGSVLGDTAEGLLERLGGADKALPSRLVERLATAFCYVPFGPKDYRANEEVLDALVQAALWQRPVEVRRETRHGTAVEERLEPLTIVMYRDGLYLLGRTAGDETREPRLYAVERIRAARVDQEATFEVPADLDPPRRFGGRLGLWEPEGRPVAIEVAFTPEAADGARKRIWPGFRRWRKARDGREVLELRLPLTPEVKTWIVGWGDQAEALRPKALRDMVASELGRALSQYAS